MKQSLIITAFICLLIGESFSIINKREKAEEKKQPSCASICSGGKAAKVKGTEAHGYIPIVNMLGYN